MPGKEIDARISRALQHHAGVTAQQKQAAWDRVYRQAGRQSLLPPLPIQEGSLGWSQFMRQSLQTFWQLATSFVSDEGQYERAYQNRYVIRYGGVTRENRLAGHLFEPLRFNLMSPAF